jgi:hypothetical protein
VKGGDDMNKPLRTVKLTGNTQEMVEQIREAIWGAKEQRPMIYRDTCEKCGEVVTTHSEKELNAAMKAHVCTPGKLLPSLPAPVLAAWNRKHKAQVVVAELKEQMKAAKGELAKADADLDTSCSEAGQGTLFDAKTGEVAG